MTDSAHNKLLKRMISDARISGGEPCVRGTRIHVAVILDSLAEGLFPEEIVEHFPPLTEQDVHAAPAHAQLRY